MSFRNNLNKIMNLTYSLASEWSIGVERMNDPFFGRAILLHVIKGKPESSSVQHQKMCYWGRKFEQLCTSVPSVEEGMHSEYCTLILSQMGHFRVLLGAEIDAYLPIPSTGSPFSSTPRPRDFVELKTNVTLQTDRQKWNFHQHKLRLV